MADEQNRSTGMTAAKKWSQGEVTRTRQRLRRRLAAPAPRPGSGGQPPHQELHYTNNCGKAVQRGVVTTPRAVQASRQLTSASQRHPGRAALAILVAARLRPSTIPAHDVVTDCHRRSQGRRRKRMRRKRL